MLTKAQSTLHTLRALQWRRAAYQTFRPRELASEVAFTDDPAWLVNQAINRRAGWPDDPSHTRGSAMPINGVYPKKASGDYYRHLRLLAHEINTPRLIVRDSRLGEHKKLILARIPERITRADSGDWLERYPSSKLPTCKHCGFRGRGHVHSVLTIEAQAHV